ncbi:hypothetical protein SH2C18_20600 [Clostridium sediminicola]|uniref:hypothetical protein n=1 Tax=Clostridium sediminicola TaxID=3114879 RepID=UPI0031F21EB5
MKNKFIVLLISIMLLSTALVGCGAKEKVNESQIADKSTEQSETKQEQVSDNDVQNELAERAKKEGVSTSKMQAMIDELTTMTAEKYGDTAENYKASLKSEGKTPFDEFATAADYMGITIKEYYEFEKQKPEMSAEDKETMQGMQDAVKELEGLDMSEFNGDVEEAQKVLEGLTGAGDREVTGDYRKVGKYEVAEILSEENNVSAGVYQVMYNSTAKTTDIVEYFNNLFVGTPDYVCFNGGDMGANMQGTLNGSIATVLIDNEDGDDVTVVEFGYMGELTKK